VNIRLNRVDESPARRFHELVTDYSMSCHVTWRHRHATVAVCSTWVVVTRDDRPAPLVNVVDTDMSVWSQVADLGHLAVQTVYTGHLLGVRAWRHHDVAKFRDALQQSTLCQPDVVHGPNVDDLAQLYIAKVSTTLDHLRRLERTAPRSGRPADQAAAWSACTTMSVSRPAATEAWEFLDAEDRCWTHLRVQTVVVRWRSDGSLTRLCVRLN